MVLNRGGIFAGSLQSSGNHSGITPCKCPPLLGKVVGTPTLGSLAHGYRDRGVTGLSDSQNSRRGITLQGVPATTVYT